MMNKSTKRRGTFQARDLWYLSRNAGGDVTTRGPISFTELCAAATAGEVNEWTMFATGAMESWGVLGESNLWARMPTAQAVVKEREHNRVSALSVTTSVVSFATTLASAASPTRRARPLSATS
ncbi:hypothetical protein DIPPA_29595 [Diplonema papillatum]|nr:hypothetical protein DIPPA_25987 [Diplonema papillatum]KAJ9448609.1 hypothetical protein DIPPA_29595 [Diplonema papillatum]